jgi:DNA-damage-inducible protein J
MSCTTFILKLTINCYLMSTIQLRIDEKTKNEAKKTLDKLGLDMSAAIKLYLRQIILRKGVPFRILTENGLTIKEEEEILKASEEAKDGKNVTGPFNSAEELIKELRKK